MRRESRNIGSWRQRIGEHVVTTENSLEIVIANVYNDPKTTLQTKICATVFIASMLAYTAEAQINYMVVRVNGRTVKSGKAYTGPNPDHFDSIDDFIEHAQNVDREITRRVYGSSTPAPEAKTKKAGRN
jgi:hypothetical protein